MKYFFLYMQIIFCYSIYPQSLQLHYDFRHSIDPKLNSKNFETVYFEYFDQKEFGSFLLKLQSDLSGQQNNIGKFYIQVSQAFCFWEPKIYLKLEYSGGLGIAEPGQFGYYINNSYSIGAAYPFSFDEAWYVLSLSYAFNVFKNPSNDILFSFYWWKGFWDYKIEFAGDMNMYTLNKNHGDAFTDNLHGKRLSFYSEPQIWFNINKFFSIGTKLNVYYHVLTYDEKFLLYPTLAVKYKL